MTNAWFQLFIQWILGNGLKNSWILEHFLLYLSGQDLIFTQGEDNVQEFYYKPRPGIYHCKYCPGLEFKCQGNVRAHVESKHYSPGYKCENCNKIFKIRNCFLTHRRKGCMVVWQRMKSHEGGHLGSGPT